MTKIKSIKCVLIAMVMIISSFSMVYCASNQTVSIEYVNIDSVEYEFVDIIQNSIRKIIVLNNGTVISVVEHNIITGETICREGDDKKIVINRSAVVPIDEGSAPAYWNYSGCNNNTITWPQDFVAATLAAMIAAVAGGTGSQVIAFMGTALSILAASGGTASVCSYCYYNDDFAPTFYYKYYWSVTVNSTVYGWYTSYITIG